MNFRPLGMIRLPLDLDYARPLIDLEFSSFWDNPSGLGAKFMPVQ